MFDADKKHFFKGYAGSYFLLFYGKLGLVQDVSLLAQYSGLIGGILLTGIGLYNQIQDSKLKKLQSKKESLEILVKEKQLEQLKQFEDE